jgi:hypothetical protein
MHGAWQIGQIEKRSALAGTNDRWIWALDGVYGGPKVICLAGAADTIGEAEAELKKSWEEWLAWAQLSDANARI